MKRSLATRTSGSPGAAALAATAEESARGKEGASAGGEAAAPPRSLLDGGRSWRLAVSDCLRRCRARCSHPWQGTAARQQRLCLTSARSRPPIATRCSCCWDFVASQVAGAQERLGHSFAVRPDVDMNGLGHEHAGCPLRNDRNRSTGISAMSCSVEIFCTKKRVWLQECQRRLRQSQKDMSTKEMLKMALEVEYMKEVVSDESWIPAVFEAQQVVDPWGSQPKTVICSRDIKPLAAVEAAVLLECRSAVAILNPLSVNKKPGALPGNEFCFSGGVDVGARCVRAGSGGAGVWLQLESHVALEGAASPGLGGFLGRGRGVGVGGVGGSAVLSRGGTRGTGVVREDDGNAGKEVWVQGMGWHLRVAAACIGAGTAARQQRVGLTSART
eukprot:s2798_g13.t1